MIGRLTLPSRRADRRYATLLQAEGLARQRLAHHPNDRYTYHVLGDDATIEEMKTAEANIPDPEFARDRRKFEAARRRLAAQASADRRSPDEEPTSDDTDLIHHNEVWHGQGRLYRPSPNLCAIGRPPYRPGRPAGRSDQGAGPVGAEHRDARRRAIASGRVNALSPLRAELHAAQYPKRPSSRP